MRDEYDFTVDELRAGIRGKYARHQSEGMRPIPIDSTAEPGEPSWPTTIEAEDEPA